MSGTPALTVHAPLAGWCLPLSDVPDPVFRDRLLGDGVAIDPTGNVVVSPFDGIVTNVADSAHSVTVTAGDGTAILIHVGIDTVALAGRGFDVHVETGARVTRGELLLAFDMDVIARSAPSLVTPVILMARDGVLLARRHSAGPVAAGEPLFDVTVGATAEPDAVTPAEVTASMTVRITLPHGLHARPAATLTRILRDFDAHVRCRAAHGRTANLHSPVTTLSLGIRAGDHITLEASGPDADAALQAAAAVLGEPVVMARAADHDAAAPERHAPRPGEVLRGQCAAGGLAAGVAAPLGVGRIAVRHEAGGATKERALFHAARTEVRRFLDGIGAGGAAREIAAAHAAFLDDPDLAGDVEARIDGGQSAPCAWQQAIESTAAGLERLDDTYLRARAADLRDVGRRVQRVLAGQSAADHLALDDASIVLADDLLPTQLMEMDRERVAGICLAGGGTSSHVAILAATFDIPMLVGAGSAVLAIARGTQLLLDAAAGELTLAADGAASRRFSALVDADRTQRREELAAAHDPCRSRDGIDVAVLANLGSPKDAVDAVANGADGCGLLRSEFLFMGRAVAPVAAEQAASFQAIADALGDRPLVVRALDAGGDKPLAFTNRAAEENPALGVRGIRLLLREPDLLQSQFEALLSVRHAGTLRMMLPMVADIGEVRRARELLDRARAQTESGTQLELGIMIETPAAALIAARLAPFVDFFSIGTNDLCQYTLAMDRGLAALAGELDALHPAVLRLVDMATRAADAAGRPISVCGTAAADSAVAAVLLGLGIRQLSVVPAAVPRVKAMIRALTISGCRELAVRALDCDSAGDVRADAEEFIAARIASETGNARSAT